VGVAEMKKNSSGIDSVMFQMDCRVCLHEAAHLVLRYVLTGSVPHEAAVGRIETGGGYVRDPGMLSGMYGPDVEFDDSYSLPERERYLRHSRMASEHNAIILFAGLEAELMVFPALGRGYGPDGTAARKVMRLWEPNDRKRRVWKKELVERARTEVKKRWPFIVMAAIVIQVKRKLDRETIYKICDFIERKSA
jgi:hypothetical protein